MTVANYITILRIFLIPVFASFAFYYGESVESGTPVEWYRWVAIITFAVASISDGIDGFIARRFNQRSKLGAVLDPLADKGLLLTALITLTMVYWGEDWKIPFWFLVLVIFRDLVIVGGVALLYHFNHSVPIRPHWTGKICTFLQMVTIVWIMLKFTMVEPLYIITIASLFTIFSGLIYVRQGIRQLPSHLNEHPET